MRPIITLLTDFGSQDYFVAAMKGVILSQDPEARIVDITHEIPPQDIHTAAFTLLACYKDFPAGTIHVAVVDPGVGSARNAIVIESGERFFVGPDNGIFSWICEREGKWRAIRLTNPKFFREQVSATFHGRDIFAPVAAALSNHTSLAEFGPEIVEIVQLESLTTTEVNGEIEARIIHIDRFGNCLTNLNRASVDENSFAFGAKLVVGNHEITSFQRFFAAAKREELFCVFGSAGFLEIAARNISAAETLNAKLGERVTLTLNRS